MCFLDLLLSSLLYPSLYLTTVIAHVLITFSVSTIEPGLQHCLNFEVFLPYVFFHFQVFSIVSLQDSQVFVTSLPNIPALFLNWELDSFTLDGLTCHCLQLRHPR